MDLDIQTGYRLGLLVRVVSHVLVLRRWLAAHPPLAVLRWRVSAAIVRRGVPLADRSVVVGKPRRLLVHHAVVVRSEAFHLLAGKVAGVL